MSENIKNLSILICDDDSVFLKYTVQSLSKVCKRVYSANDGELAYKVYQEHKDDIDVILTDVNMPNLDGIGFAKRIREGGDDSKTIIVMSAFDDVDYIKDAVKLNITRFLAKPIEYDLLFGMLKEISTLKYDELYKKELKELFDLTDKYIYISKTDKRGVITYVSDAFSKVSGYSKDELIGKQHNIVRHTDMPQEDFANMWHTIQSGEIWQGEVKNLKKDGGYYWVNATVSPLKNDKNEIVGYQSVRVDITNKKDIELLNKELEDRVKRKVKALREKDEMLQSQSRNAMMGEMISMIAHQWRQPLSTISLIINDINMKYHLNTLNKDNLKVVMDKANQTIQYMSKTIDDFREFFKPNKSKEYVFFEKTIDNAIGFVEPLIKKYEIELTKDIKNDKNIVVYKNEVLQVLINLLKNSIDSLVENSIENPKISITIDDIDDTKVIVFSDNGGGIPQEIISRVFEPYFSTKKRNGTGLGLYMSKTIIEDHLQGSIVVENSKNGAKFTIKIPFS
jgi:PAS domain S-box-containing protein